MRRPRIKVQANVPIRRKNLVVDANTKASPVKKEHEAQNGISNDQNSPKTSKKSESDDLKVPLIIDKRTPIEIKQELISNEKNNKGSITRLQEHEIDRIQKQLEIFKEEDESWIKPTSSKKIQNNPATSSKKLECPESSENSNAANESKSKDKSNSLDHVNICVNPSSSDDVMEIPREETPTSSALPKKIDNCDLMRKRLGIKEDTWIRPTSPTKIQINPAKISNQLKRSINNGHDLLECPESSKKLKKTNVSPCLSNNSTKIPIEALLKNRSLKRKLNPWEEEKASKNQKTMYDLIYEKTAYTQQGRKQKNENKKPIKKPVMQNVNKSSVPAPRVKVGANGELVIDTESIFIEQTKNQPGIDDLEDVISGAPKKRPGGRMWTAWEDLKFFKALKTFGTDFTLMQKLFPRRSRNELKLKFKREEKKNNGNTDEALFQQELNPDAIEKEFELYNKEEHDAKLVKNLKFFKEAPKNKKRKRGKCCIVTSSIDSYGVDDFEDDPEEQKNSENEVLVISGNDRNDPLQVEEDRSSKAESAKKDNSPSTSPSPSSPQSGFLKVKDPTKLICNKPVTKRQLSTAKISVRIFPDSEIRSLKDFKNVLPNARCLKAGTLVFVPKLNPVKSSDIDVFIVNEMDPLNANEEQTMSRVDIEPSVLAAISKHTLGI